jgi:hypothetical protein
MATALILDELNGKTKQIFPIDYPLIQVEDFTRNTLITDILPFRVKFSAIQVVLCLLLTSRNSRFYFRLHSAVNKTQFVHC